MVSGLYGSLFLVFLRNPNTSFHNGCTNVHFLLFKNVMSSILFGFHHLFKQRLVLPIWLEFFFLIKYVRKEALQMITFQKNHENHKYSAYAFGNLGGIYINMLAVSH